MALFCVSFIGSSFPIPSNNFRQVDETHWVLDVGVTVTPTYLELKEVSLFLLQPNTVTTGAALGLYVSVGGAEWQFRGCVSNEHPSEVMPLQWPHPEGNVGTHPIAAPGMVQLGVSLEPMAELAEKEGSKLASRHDFARRVAIDLYRFLESFNVSAAGNQLVLPSDVLDRWMAKFDHKFRRDPDFLMHAGEKT